MGKLSQIDILPDEEYDFFSPVPGYNYYVFQIPYAQEIYIKGSTRFGGTINVSIYDLDLNVIETLNDVFEGSISMTNPGIYYFQISGDPGGSFYTEYYSYDDFYDDLQMDLNLQGVLELYTAYFNRAADKDGVDYWLKTMVKNDWSLDTISEVFSEQDEYVQTYSNLSNSEIIQKVYSNILNRTVDSEGLNYWEGQLNNGNIKVSHFIQALVNAVLEKDGNGNYINLTDATILNNKLEVSEYFYKNNLNSTDFLLNTVNIETSSVEELKSQIDQIVLDSIDMESYSYVNDSIKTFTSDYNISTLDSTLSWDKSVITYSFNESIPNEYYELNNLNSITDFSPLASSQRDSVRDIFSQFNQLFGVKFQESTNGDIRFNITNFVNNVEEGDLVAFSYYPIEGLTVSGDVFLSQDYFLNQDIVQGEFIWDVIVHELGHSLGLKHPFETSPILDPSIDNTYHTIMSYTEKYNYTPTFKTDANGNNIITNEINSPELFSLFDVAALQLKYGINPTTNLGDTTYSFSYDDTISTTIFDAGGIDTIDLSSNKGNTTLDLNSGTLNSIDEHSLDEVIAKYESEIPNENFTSSLLTDTLTSWYDDDLLYTGKNNVAISYGTIIENVITGSGDDIVIDNEVDNIINTSAGDDYIYLGKGGADYVNGGAGTDYINLSYLKDDVLVKDLDNNKYLLFSDNYLATVENVELIKFADSSIYLSIDLFT